jgi:hypothetical protein
VTLTRRHAFVLLAIAAWNVLSYTSFTRNLYESYAAGEDRPPGYWVAHAVLIVVNLLVAVVLARWGWRAWRAHPSPDEPAEAREAAAADS